MKNLLFNILILGLLVSSTSCRQQAKTSDVQNTTMEQKSAIEVENGIKIDTIRMKKVFKAAIDRPLYCEKSYYIEWPVSLHQEELSTLQAELLRVAFYQENTTDIDAFIKKEASSFTDNPATDHRWIPVEHPRPAQADKHAESFIETNDDYPLLDPSFSYSVRLNVFNPETGLIMYSISENFDTGGIGGLSLGNPEKCVYYDSKAKKIIHLNDIFTAEGLDYIIRKLKRDPIMMGHYDCLWGESEMGFNELPEHFIFKDDNLYFIFPKYVAACGSDETVCLGIRLSEASKYMTSYGHEIFTM